MLEHTLTSEQTQKHELNKAFVSLRNDGIMQIEIKETEEFLVQDVKDVLSVVGEIGGEKKYPILTIVNGYVLVDKETRAYLACEEGNRYTLADAFVINSLALKLVGNFYLKFDNPKCPTKIFNCPDDAAVWLKTHI